MRPLPALLLPAALLLMGPSLASAQEERTAVQRQTLGELAFVMGQLHALDQGCKGRDSQFWRARMQRLEQVEQADARLTLRLREGFNTGYAAAQAEHPRCSREAEGAARQAAARGRSLAVQMAQATTQR